MVKKMKLLNSKYILKLSILIITILVFVVPIVSIESKSCDIASWYGDGEKLNKHTANGEIFNSKDLTCATWNYKFNARLKVTNLENSKYVIVRVNDRGPNKRLGRAIDLTKHAFSKIANTDKGLVLVKIEKVN